jgi:hypothetical protein
MACRLNRTCQAHYRTSPQAGKMPGVPGRQEIQRHVADLGRSLKAGVRRTGRPALVFARMISARWKALRRVTAKALDRLRSDSRLRRRALLYTFGAAVSITAVVTVILTVIVLSSSASSTDRLAAVGDVLMGATLFLAVIAAVVALLAYAISTGPPDIRFSVEFPGAAYANDPIFEAHADADKPFQLRWLGAERWKILLKNESGYSAKNPALIIRFNTMSFRPFTNPEDVSYFERNWTVIDSAIHVYDLWVDEWEGFKAVQWDGGPAYSIHGHSTRRLPDFDPRRVAANTSGFTFNSDVRNPRRWLS